MHVIRSGLAFHQEIWLDFEPMKTFHRAWNNQIVEMQALKSLNTWHPVAFGKLKRGSESPIDELHFRLKAPRQSQRDCCSSSTISACQPTTQ